MSEQTLSKPLHTKTPGRGWITPLLDIVIVSIPLFTIAFTGVFLGGSASGGATLYGSVIINLAYIAPMLVGGWVLRRRGSGWQKIGLARPDSWGKTLLWGLGAAVINAVVIIGVQVIVLNLPGREVAPSDITRFNPLVGNVSLLIFALIASWTTTGFGEEMYFRAFLITRLEKVFASSKFATALAVAGSTLAFGAVHFAEGPLGMVAMGSFGLVQALIYIRTDRKNLWVTIIAHGILNTIRYVMVFYGAV